MTRNLMIAADTETYGRCQNEAIYLVVQKVAELTKVV